MIKEVRYGAFGVIEEDTNPALYMPIGFAGGLHDRDVGFVRFGYRDYDPKTSRFTAKDPLGYAAGEGDLYGYCFDDPVNGVDPLGLFRFGKRPLGVLPETWHGVTMDNSLADQHNFEPKHEHGFYEDGSGENIGFGKKGKMTKEDITKYQLDDTHYDDKRMHRAQDSTVMGDYRLVGNNCQDYADRLRQRYGLLDRGDKMR